MVRTWNGFLLWLSRSESDLVLALLEASGDGNALPVSVWLDPTGVDFERRVIELPGLLARGVVQTQERDGATWLSLHQPTEVGLNGSVHPDSPPSEAPHPGNPHPGNPHYDHRRTVERAVQADVVGAVLRARGGRWLLRSDAAVPASDRAHSTPSERTYGSDPAIVTSQTLHRFATSWRGGSTTALHAALLDLVDVDHGIIAGIRRGSGLPQAVPVWFAGPNRAFGTADPSALSWRLPGSAMGKGLTDDEAQLSALAEAAEHWSGTWRRADGTAAVAGRDLASGNHVEVPANVVYMGHPPVNGHVRHTDSNGLAAGVTLADAQLQALLEIIERDAISSWWDGVTRGAVVNRALWDEEALHPFVEWLEWLGITVELRELPSLEGTTTLLAVGWLPDTNRWLYGAGTHIQPEIAVRRAVLELVQSTAAGLATARQVAPGRGIAADLFPKPLPEQPPNSLVARPPLTHRATPQFSHVSAAVEQLARNLTAHGRPACAVDVTRAEVGVPVARVIVRGQRGMPLPMR